MYHSRPPLCTRCCTICLFNILSTGELQHLHNHWHRGRKVQPMEPAKDFLCCHFWCNYAATIIISGGASVPQGRVVSRDSCLPTCLNISAAFIIPADENLTGRPPPTTTTPDHCCNKLWLISSLHPHLQAQQLRLITHENNHCFPSELLKGGNEAFQVFSLKPKHQFSVFWKRK